MKWYKRDPNAALTGMASLTLEERGAYNTVLDLIYAHDGAVDDKARFLAGWCGVDVRVWKRIREKLIAEKKLYVNGSTLRNARADWEIDAALHKGLQRRDAALSKGPKSGVDSKIIKGLAPAPAEHLLSESRIQNRLLLSSLQRIPPRARARGRNGRRVDRPKTTRGRLG
jgi:hypothetical protein